MILMKKEVVTNQVKTSFILFLWNALIRFDIKKKRLFTYFNFVLNNFILDFFFMIYIIKNL